MADDNKLLREEETCKTDNSALLYTMSAVLHIQILLHAAQPEPAEPFLASHLEPFLAAQPEPCRATRTIPRRATRTSGKKNSALCAFTGIQRIERFQHYLPLVNNGALRGKRCNVRSACGRLDAPSSFTRRRALISANSLLRTIFSTCRRYSWRGDDDSHHLPLHAEVR